MMVGFAHGRLTADALPFPSDIHCSWSVTQLVRPAYPLLQTGSACWAQMSKDTPLPSSTREERWQPAKLALL